MKCCRPHTHPVKGQLVKTEAKPVSVKNQFFSVFWLFNTILDFLSPSFGLIHTPPKPVGALPLMQTIPVIMLVR